MVDIFQYIISSGEAEYISTAVACMYTSIIRRLVKNGRTLPKNLSPGH